MSRSALASLLSAVLLLLSICPARAFDLTANHEGLAVEWVQNTQGRATDFACGDADEDGDVDLFVIDDSTLQLWRNDRTGRFTIEKVAACSFPVSAVLALSVDGDSHLDLVVAVQAVDGGIAVLRGVGDGAFRFPEMFTRGRTYSALVDAGTDAHGVRNLLGRSQESVFGFDVLVQDGNAFWVAATYLSGMAVYGAASVDVNGDGRIDVVASARLGDEPSVLMVLLGTAVGFIPAAQIEHQPVTHIIGLDIDGNGTRDLIVATDSAADVIFGDGSGRNWLQGGRLCDSSEPPGVFATDIDRDGALEVFLAWRDGVEAGYLDEYRGPDLWNAAPLKFSYMHTQEYPIPPTSMLSADFNGDGELDLALRTESIYERIGQGMISVIARRQSGELGGIRLHPLPEPRYFHGLVSAHLRKKGPPELVFQGREGLFMASLKDGELAAPTRIGVGSSSYWSAHSIRAVDLNLDGLDDLIVAMSQDLTDVRLTSEDGTPGAVVTRIGGMVTDVRDIDGDRLPDLLLSQSGSLEVAWGDSQNHFENRTRVLLPPDVDYPWDRTVFADVDGDGRLEIVNVRLYFRHGGEPEPQDEVSVYRVSDSREIEMMSTSQIGTILEPNTSASQVQAVNLDGSAGDELVVLADPSGWNGSSLVVLRFGTGRYVVAGHCPIGGEGPASLAFADLDGDRDLDAVCTANFEAYMGMLHVRWNDGRGNFTGDWARRIANGRANGVAIDDFDGDGAPDLAIESPEWDGSASRIAFLFGSARRSTSVSRSVLSHRPNWTPASPIAIQNISPNPARDAFTIEWTARPGVPIDIELNDVAGHRVLRERLITPGTTQRATHFRPPEKLPAGLYWIRLRQGNETATRRVVLVK